MNAVAHKHYVIVDVETTGLTPQENELIEIGAVKLTYTGKSFKMTGKYHTLIKPYKQIPHNIQNLTNITPDMVKNAPRFEEVYTDFLDFVGDAVFVAHNAQFDLQMINISLARVGGTIITSPMVDTQQLIAITYPTLSSHKLGEVARILEVKRKHGHRALDDAIVTAEVFKKCLAGITSFKPAVLIEINKLLSSHSWPLKEVFLAAQEKVCKKMTIEERGKLRGWAHIVGSAVKFKRRPEEEFERELSALSIEELESVFDKSGRLAKLFKSFEYREPQKKMLRLVADSFNGSTHAVVEAGTGTGKTLAYAVPAVYWALQNKMPVVISTRTKNLQSQLMEKDMAIIKKVIGQDVNVLLLKGRENYVCLRRVELVMKRIMLEGNLEQVINAIPLLTWLGTTETGDLSELHPLIHRIFFAQVRSDATTCLGSQCALNGFCFLENIRKQARRADILIVNHALLCADIAGDGYLLPEYRHVIIDEGHALEDAATESFSLVLSVQKVLDELKRFQIASEERLQASAGDVRGKTFDLFESLVQFTSSHKKISYGEEMQVLIDTEAAGKPEWSALMDKVAIWREACMKLLKASQALMIADETKQLEIKSAEQNLQRLCDQMAFVFDHSETGHVRWISAASATPPFNCTVKAAPIEIGPFLHEHLFEKKDSVVITSATLTVGDSFSYFVERLGFDPEASEIPCHALGSPFNYQEQLLFCVPKDFPSSEEDAFVRRTKELFLKLFEVTQGRALVLFTSYRMLQKVYSKLRIDLERKGLTLLCQGKHGSRRAILNRFKENDRSVLFGTDSFWEGVDVPGKALSMVVMMKLPFAVPTEPITAARLDRYTKKGRDGFFSYSVPQAIVKFRQGLGRLIRTKDDKGVVLLMDNRVLTKNYGKAFLRSIPGNPPQVLTPDDIVKKTAEWLK